MPARPTRTEKLVRYRRRGGTRPRPVAPIRERRPADTAQDTAFYTCTCGYVFEAEVSTTVGCPHCGNHQAW